MSKRSNDEGKAPGRKPHAPDPSTDRLTELERQAEEAKKTAADSERRADETVRRAEELKEQDQQLEAGEEKLRRQMRDEPMGPLRPKGPESENRE